MKAALEISGTGRRGRFEGVWQILRFNYPLFVGAVVGVMAGMVILYATPRWSVMWWIAAAGTVAGAWWAAATLAVSHYVYDCSDAFGFGWFRPYAGKMRAWANVHAGFDQTSVMLRRTFGGSRGVPVDLFDAKVMTERSIHRARAKCGEVAGTVRGHWDRLPLQDGEVDVVFMLFAAHELRERGQRVRLFSEAKRVVSDGGVVVMAEHMRGIANFAVFGPGVFHFHSRREWLIAGAEAGLRLIEERNVTPFARIFIWRKGV